MSYWRIIAFAAGILLFVGAAGMIYYMISEDGAVKVNSDGEDGMQSSDQISRNGSFGDELPDFTLGDKTLEDALDAMSRSAVKGDPRTPEISTISVPRLWQPDEEALRNPREYERRETEAVETARRNFLEASAIRTDTIERNINQALLEGNRSSEDIREAQTALEELKKLRSSLGAADRR